MKIFFVNDTSHSGHPGSKYSVDFITNHLLDDIGQIEILSIGEYPSVEERKTGFAIINGEGTIHGPHLTPRIAWILRVIELFDGRVVLINASIYQVKRWIPELNRCRTIFVRETRSQSYLNSISVKAELSADMTFSFPNNKVAAVERKGIGVTDSSRIWASRVGFVLSRVKGMDYVRLDEKNTLRQKAYSHGHVTWLMLTFCNHVFRTLPLSVIGPHPNRSSLQDVSM